MKGTPPQLDPWELNAVGLKSPGAATSSAVAGLILRVLHFLTFLPILLAIVLQDFHLKLAVVLNTTLCICLAVGNLCFNRMGIVKVFPKTLDTFLLLLYVSMIPVVYTQAGWLAHWMNVYHHGAVAVFMWLSVLLPCWDNFVLEALRDKLPDHLWQLPTSTQAALRASLTWAGALTTMALLAVAPAVMGRDALNDPVHIICDYALPLLLLLGAWVARALSVNGAVAAAHRWQDQHEAEVGVAVSAVPASSPAQATLAAAATPARYHGSAGLPPHAEDVHGPDGSSASGSAGSLRSNSDSPAPCEGASTASRLLRLLRLAHTGRRRAHAGTATPAAGADAC